ncbi:MAG: amino acid permease [Pseudohongiellaceae bacterium]
MSKSSPQSISTAKVAWYSATALVIANIIGAGIFTTTGFQAASLGHPTLILMLWMVGGLLAWCGAQCYAELGAMMPRAGAEYAYLRETFGPLFGFMSAVISLVAGFSAAIAAALKALIRYLSAFFPVLSDPVPVMGLIKIDDAAAIVLVWLLVAVHSRSLSLGFRFNDLVTLMKVTGITLILLLGFAVGDGDVANLAVVSQTFYDQGLVQLFSSFSVSLIFVMFCFSGWNAAAYIAHEIKDVQKNLPRALMLGTLIVTGLYLALNLLYFYGADVFQLSGVAEVGLVAAEHLFGTTGVTLTVIVLSVSIFASASAMTIAGPRVYFALGQDHKLLGFLARTKPHSSVPVNALVLQGIVTTLLILSARIDQIIQYAGFSLVLFSALAVASVMVLRKRRPDLERPFKVTAYPFTPVLFLCASLWMMIWNLTGPYWFESLMSLATVGLAALLFSLLNRAGE